MMCVIKVKMKQDNKCRKNLAPDHQTGVGMAKYV
jgi:hypothetical protein